MSKWQIPHTSPTAPVERLLLGNGCWAERGGVLLTPRADHDIDFGAEEDDEDDEEEEEDDEEEEEEEEDEEGGGVAACTDCC